MTLSLQDPGLLARRAPIDGEWIDARDGATAPVVNPATGALLASVPRCGAAETQRAIDAAQRALPAWRGRTAAERAELLRRLYQLMMAHQDDLARILTAEQGKPLAEARAEIAYSAGFIEWFAEEARRVYGDTIPAPRPDQRILVIKQAIGVVACITPWNFPSAMLGRKLGAALAAGCTVVCKPASATPLSAFALAVLAERAGFPPGTINMVSGDTQAIGEELTANPLVRKLTFTGSTAVGKTLLARCAGTVKRTSMELGGNAPFIVFDDADLDAAVAGAMVSKYRNAGQTCVCANRLLVHDAVYDAFAEKFCQASRTLRVGNGVDEGVAVGPLINAAATQKVRSLIDDAIAQGARVLTGGSGTAGLQGNFLAPTVLADATPRMRVFREEIFGPVAPLYRFRTEAEALALANDTPYGLAAYFYSRDIGRVWRVGEALEYGIIGVNEGLVSTPVAPFGGIKESGHGREGSKYGLDDYLEIKYLCLGGI